MKLLWVVGFMGMVLCRRTDGFADVNGTKEEDLHYTESNVYGYGPNGYGVFSRPLMVGLTLINGAAAKGAGLPLSLTLPLWAMPTRLLVLITKEKQEIKSSLYQLYLLHITVCLDGHTPS